MHIHVCIRHQATIVLALTLTACADVKVQRVPHPLDLRSPSGAPSKKQWNDRQLLADEMEGMRYYLPRPWMVVKREFMVDSEVWFESAQLDLSTKTLTFDPKSSAVQAGAIEPSLGLSQVKDGTRPTSPAAKGTTQVQSEESQESGSADLTPKVVLLKDADHLKGTKFEKASFVSPGETIDITLNANLDTLGKLQDPDLTKASFSAETLALIPVVAGKLTEKGIVELAKIGTGASTQSKLDFKSGVQPSAAPSFSAIAAKAEVQVDGKTQVYYLAGPLGADGAILSNPFFEAKTEGDDKSEGKSKKESTKKSESQSKASISTSGDPATDPRIELTELFDILLLPDFTEQYAIHASSGLGVAQADFGFENGWMVEKASFNVDNTSVGEFIYEAAETLVASLFPPAAAAESITDMMDDDPLDDDSSLVQEINLQSENNPGAKTRTVLVKIARVEYAVPGTYPLLKSKELTSPGGRLQAPRFDLTRRTDLLVSVVRDLGPSKGANASKASRATTLLFNNSEPIKSLAKAHGAPGSEPGKSLHDLATKHLATYPLPINTTTSIDGTGKVVVTVDLKPPTANVTKQQRLDDLTKAFNDCLLQKQAQFPNSYADVVFQSN